MCMRLIAILFLLLICAVTAFPENNQGSTGAASKVHRAAMLKKRRTAKLMEIKFVRSGGFAGPATSVRGVVQFTDQGAKVTSEPGNYARELQPEETGQLRAGANPASLSKAQSALQSGASQMPDGYQYDITLVTDDGKSQNFTVGDGAAQRLEGVAPDTAKLVNWVQQEIQTIWAHRIGKR